jgi:hypothetical protein
MTPHSVFVVERMIPALDRQARERWGNDPSYQDYVRRTSKLLLLLPGRRA